MTAVSGGRAARREAVLARFALFAECLLTGVWLVVAALPLVTALPAFAAACGHLRRYLAGERATWRDFGVDLFAATRSGWRFGLLWWAGLGLCTFDIRVAGSGALPGGEAVLGLTALGGVFLALAGLRTAAAWRVGDGWRATAATAVRRCVADPGGTLLLAGGLAVVLVAGWQLAPLAVPALGCLAAAAVAVERRAAQDTRTRTPDQSRMPR